MKKVRYILIVFATMFLLFVTCKKDENWLTKCDHCPSSSPWSVWNLDLSNPCFPTKSECENWAEQHVPGNQWKCEQCDQ